MEHKAFYKELVDRYVARMLTDEELEVFSNLVREGKLDHELSMAMEREGQLSNLDETVAAPRIRKLWPRLAGIAAAIAIIGFGAWFVYSLEGSADRADQLKYVKKDIAPGKNGATLTLANGRVITLSSARTAVAIGSNSLTYADGSAVLANEHSGTDLSNTDITAATGRAQTYALTLPDGTRVWLNAATKLTFPSNISSSEKRTIILDGEAYFEVYKDKAHPFIVEVVEKDNLPEQEVTVVGTHFNVSAYSNNEQIKTTLLEGSVQVKMAGKGKDRTIPGADGAILKVNQQSVVSHSSKIVIENVNAQESVDWKNGTFVFEHQKLSEILKEVERWYDVRVTYKDDILRNQTFTGEISRNDHVSELLKILERTGKVSFDIQGRTIIVDK
jgi:transmembrane sensor